MSASESSPITTNLQESIEHLIAETVRRSQVDHDEETKQLRTALEEALTEVEAGQAAMNRAASLLRSALDTPATGSTPAEPADAVVEEFPTPTEEPQPAPATETPATTDQSPEIGPHGLDVVAHDVNIGIASSLQSWLRERPEVTNAQTREFVNGELRLRLEMASALDMDSLSKWVAKHKGRIATQTSSVLELRFGS